MLLAVLFPPVAGKSSGSLQAPAHHIHPRLRPETTSLTLHSLGQERRLWRRLSNQYRAVLPGLPARPTARVVHCAAEPRVVRAVPAGCGRRARNNVLCDFARAGGGPWIRNSCCAAGGWTVPRAAEWRRGKLWRTGKQECQDEDTCAGKGAAGGPKCGGGELKRDAAADVCRCYQGRQ
jgi:hypothetical protein